MSRDFEYEIRDAVVDLAEEGRSVNLAAAAIRDGRHIVRRRRAVSAAATFAVLAVLVVPFALHRPTTRIVQPGAAAPPPVPAATSSAAGAAVSAVPTPAMSVPGPAALPDGMVYGSLPRDDGSSLVYDRSTGRYVRLPFAGIVPSPAGSTAAIDDGRRVGLVDLATGAVRWAVGPAPAGTAFDWSPDGTQLTYLAKGGKTGTVRVTVLTVAKAFAASVGADFICPLNCSSAWLPDGRSIAVSGMDGKLPIRLVDFRTGSLTKGLERVTGVLTNGHGVTDDGTLVVTQIGPQATVTVAATGRVILSLPDEAAQAYWSSGNELLVVRGDGVARYSFNGAPTDTYPFPPGILTTGAGLPTLMRG